MSVAVVVYPLVVLLGLWSIVYIVRVRLEPRRMRADAEVRRAYLLHVRGRDAEPEVLLRQLRIYWVTSLVLISLMIVMTAVYLAAALAAL